VTRIREQALGIGFGAAVGVIAGAASALFLALLELATRARNEHAGLVYALPAAGLAIGWLYERFGAPIRAGSNLVIDTIHDGGPGPELPARLAPMVLIGTVLTHLFGGSAGREGTAVQMGAGLADTFAHRTGASPSLRRQLLAAGAAGGFGSVFGTPVAGAIFGLEFVVLGRIQYAALAPALVAALVGDMTTRALGIGHTPYPEPGRVALTLLLLCKWLVFAGAVAATTVVFIETTHRLKRLAERVVPRLPLRMALGGAILVLMWRGTGTDAYLGLGIPTILRSFHDPALPEYAFAAKLLFTAVTLSAGFLGGEVTPLFFVGAALGNALARPLGLPLDLAAGVGLAAVFAAAANTPLALSVMAVELLGGNLFPHVAIVCVTAYFLTGHRGIYSAQRLLQPKHGGPPLATAVTLKDRGVSAPETPVPPDRSYPWRTAVRPRPAAR
jgi:H+/Cl- antiporter ClcA